MWHPPVQQPTFRTPCGPELMKKRKRSKGTEVEKVRNNIKAQNNQHTPACTDKRQQQQQQPQSRSHNSKTKTTAKPEAASKHRTTSTPLLAQTSDSSNCNKAEATTAAHHRSTAKPETASKHRTTSTSSIQPFQLSNHSDCQCVPLDPASMKKKS